MVVLYKLNVVLVFGYLQLCRFAAAENEFDR